MKKKKLGEANLLNHWANILTVQIPILMGR